MPRLIGTIVASGAPAEGAYVQIQNLAGDFQAEVRADAAGRFVLHPIRGRWRLVCWLPGGGRAEQEVEVGAGDLDVEVALAWEVAQVPPERDDVNRLPRVGVVGPWLTTRRNH
jgi:hypothetical protein